MRALRVKAKFAKKLQLPGQISLTDDWRKMKVEVIENGFQYVKPINSNNFRF